METREAPVPRSTARRRWLPAVLVLILLFTFVLAGKGSAATAYDAEELEFLDLINGYREENGLRPVVLSDTLAVAAERHSRDMAEHGFFAHNTKQSSYYPAGSEPWDRMEAEGYEYNTAKGENLAVGYETAEEAMRAWKESASHNAAMLDGNYLVMGVARVNVPGSAHGWYWTTDFGGHVDPSAHAPDGSPANPGSQQPAGNAAPKKPAGPSAPPNRGAGGPAPDTDALDSGDLGKARGWSQQARDGADLVLEDGYARLGGYHDGQDELRQRVKIGADATLAYDVRVRAGRGDSDDTMLVRLTDREGEQVAVLEQYDGREAVGWERGRADLSRFAGRTLFLSFNAQTDAERLTIFQLDKLTLEA